MIWNADWEVFAFIADITLEIPDSDVSRSLDDTQWTVNKLVDKPFYREKRRLFYGNTSLLSKNQQVVEKNDAKKRGEDKLKQTIVEKKPFNQRIFEH